MPLEVADDPCYALLSSSGLLARTSSDELPGSGGARANHDVVVSAVPATARGEVGVVTSRGRLLKLGVLDLPALPASANDPHLQGGLPLSLVVTLDPGDQITATLTTSNWDAAVYLIADCAASDTTCVAGSDSGNPETFTFTHNGAVAATYFLIVDAWRASDMTTTREGQYQLDISIQ